MKHLSFQDLQLLLSAIENLNADSDPQTLPQRTLSAASKIISADSVAFTGFSYGGEYAGIAWENAGNISPADLEAFARYVHENPLMKSYIVERRSETLKITDLISPKEFKRTNLYNEFYR
nr:hypothetical protein [Acidobacteriota bacterium]